MTTPRPYITTTATHYVVSYVTTRRECGRDVELPAAYIRYDAHEWDWESQTWEPVAWIPYQPGAAPKRSAAQDRYKEEQRGFTRLALVRGGRS